MTVTGFILRSLRFHWRNHLGVLLGATLATTILVGALAVGDSVRHSLARQALMRLGQVHFVVNTHDRFFRADLAADLAAQLQAPVAPIVAMSGLFSTADGRKRVNHLQVFGGDDRFWAMGNPPKTSPSSASWIPDATAWGNPEFARRIRPANAADAPTGGIIRIEKPTWLPRDAPISSGNDSSSALRVTLTTSRETHDRFSLQANQTVPPSLMVALPWLQKEIEKPARANVLLIGQNAAATLTVDQVNAALRRVWTLSDADLELVEVDSPFAGGPVGAKAVELRTERVFLESPITEAAKVTPPAQQVLTYFVNELRRGELATPYSFVAALDHAAPSLPLGGPAPLQDDEIVLNAWVAEDLQAKVGDTITLKYFVVGPGRTLEERESGFKVRAIVPVTAGDAALTPKIPGLSDKENCRDWDPGTTINLDRIRPRDEEYWEKHHGTPKAFVSLAAGEKMWDNRFGHRTALRWPATDSAALATKLRDAIDPAKVGLFARPVRAQALQAAGESQDFGGLFIGLSFFLIVAALLLMGLLFAFSVDQRSREIGTLLAVGWTPRAVKKLFLLEGLALAVVGGALGTVAGLGYTKAVLWALLTQWSGAIAGAELWFHAEPATLAIGAVASALIAWLVIWLVLRRAARLPARALLAGAPATAEDVGPAAAPDVSSSRWRGLTPSRFRPTPAASPSSLPEPAAWGQAAPPRARKTGRGGKAGLLAAGSGLLAAFFLARGFLGDHSAADFFGAGAMLLIAGLAACSVLIARLAGSRSSTLRSAAALALQNVARRRGRSLTTIGLLACGSFLVIAVGANRHDPAANAPQRSSGTGGFAFFGESTLPLHADLNSPASRENLGLPKGGLEDLRVVALRMREGDDASCLNLNRAQVPRLLAVDPRALAERGSFTFLGSSSGGAAAGNPWLLLDAPLADGAVPAIGDEATVRWALGQKVGGTLSYTDERGRTFPLRIVGMLANSVLQGSLVIAERNFVAQFPSESGQRVFLIDAPAPGAKGFADALTQGLRDYGLELQPAADRLALFQQVENTYLTIFQALGGLGLLLGSVGLGVVVLRNALERRSELALLRAVGFTRIQLQRLIVIEHGGLLLLGLACGVGAAIVAVLPALRASASQVPYQSLGLTLAALLASGTIWIWLAGGLALRGELMRALRNE